MSAQRPKVLVLVDWFWPGFRAGGPIRSTHNLILWLKRDIDFSVITSDRDHLETKSYTEVQSDQWNTTPDGIRVHYANLQTFNRAKLAQLVEQEKPDYLLTNSMFSVPFTQWPLRLWGRHRGGMRILLAPRGMLAAGALSVKATKKKAFLALFKLLGWHKRVTFVATGAHEAEDIRRHFGANVKIRIAPNLPEPTLPAATALEKSAVTTFLSVARISPEKNNLWMLEQFAKLKSPAKLILIGPIGNQDYWNQCQAVIHKMPSHLQVIAEGPKSPDHVRQMLRHSHFLLLPTLGENFGHAIIEALTAGRPVIISDKTPWRGLERDHAGWDLPLEEQVFLEAMERASFMSQSEYNEWSEGARKRAELFLHDPELARLNLDVFKP